MANFMIVNSMRLFSMTTVNDFWSSAALLVGYAADEFSNKESVNFLFEIIIFCNISDVLDVIFLW